VSTKTNQIEGESKSRSLLNDGLWVAASQVFAALGQLAGIRILTEILTPGVFGSVSLYLGMVALFSVGYANPTMQAVLRYYPEYLDQGGGGGVRAVAFQQIMNLIIYSLPALIVINGIAFWVGWVNMEHLVLLVALIFVEMARMQNTTVLNAVRAHREFGIWSVAESWGRPLLAYVLIGVFGATTTVVLFGFFIASLVIFVVMRRYVPQDTIQGLPVNRRPELKEKFWKYSMPLLPLGMLGWVSGMADRYIIGSLLSPADVGLYVAVYSIASRPMLMLGRVIETTIRPAYQKAVVERNHDQAKDYLLNWLLVIAIGGIGIVVFSAFAHEWICNILLGPDYRKTSGFLPWITGGYLLLISSHLANRICYANNATKAILAIEGFNAFLILVIGFICIYNIGLFGAVIAVPICYGLKFLLSIYLAWPWVHPAKQ
jgi:O-antigen/teichoic acid export membrane protein